MRRLWPAIGVFALVAGCGRPNPGFKLIESGGGDSDSASFGSTDSGVATGTPPTSTTTTGVTGTAGSEGSVSATVSGTTGDTGGTTTPMGMHWEFPTGCMDGPTTSGYAAAVADTFFLYEYPVTECSWLLGEPLDPDCFNLQFSKALAFQLYLNSGGTEEKSDDYVALYAVRFEMPKFMDEIDIPDYAYVSIDAKIRVAPLMADPNEWQNVTLAVRRFSDGDVWTEDKGLEFTPCHASAASFRCLTCTSEVSVEADCEAEWGSTAKNPHPGIPYDLDLTPIPPIPPIPVELPSENEYLAIPFTADDLPWLTKEGMILMPADELPQNIAEVKTRESPAPPGLDVVFCTPTLVPDN